MGIGIDSRFRLVSEYIRYYLHFSTIVMIPILISKLIKVRKGDKVNDTENFKFSMYNILISGVILGIIFFVISKN